MSTLWEQVNQASPENEALLIQTFFQETSEPWLHLLESLQEPLMNSTNDMDRSNAMQFLARVLSLSLPLDKDTLRHLTTFMVSRLKDTMSVPGAIRSLILLLKRKDWMTGDLQLLGSIVFTLMTDVQVSSYQRLVRASIYELYEILVLDYAQDLKPVQDSLIGGIVQAIDNEKDPRNLLISFRLVSTVCQSPHLDVTHHVEDLFDVSSCYFPITFRPPPDDPNGLTLADLQESLRSCLLSTPLFAPFCLPLLLEKLESSIVSAKVDALETFTACCHVYSPDLLVAHLAPWQQALQEAVYQAPDGNTERAGLQAIRALVTCVSSRTALLMRVVSPMLARAVESLQESDSKAALNASALIVACASANDKAFAWMSERVIPHLVRQFESSAVPNQRRLPLDLIATLCGFAASFQPELMQPYKDMILTCATTAFLQDASSSANVHIAALKCLGALSSLSLILSEQELNLIMDQCYFHALHSQHLQVRDVAVEQLQKLAALHTPAISQRLVPQILTVVDDKNVNIALCSFDLLLKLTVCDAALPLMIQHFCELQRNDPSHTSLWSECLLAIMDAASENALSDLPLLLNWLLQWKDLLKEQEQPNLLLCLCSSISRLFSCQSVTSQSTLLANFSLTMDEPYFMLGILAGIRRQVLAESGLASLFNVLARQRDPILYCCMAIVTSKRPVSEEFKENVLDWMKDIQSEHVSLNEKISLLCLLQWIMKALILQSHALATTVLLPFFLNCLEIEELGDAAVRCFEMILRPCAYWLNKTTHSQVQVLHEQRFFNEFVPALMKQFSSSSSDASRSRCLLVLSHVLKWMPEVVVRPKWSVLMPLLLQAISISQLPLLRSSTVPLLRNVLKQSPNLIGDHLERVLTALLDLVRRPESSEQIILESLQCLAALSELPFTVIYPFRIQVIRSLQLPLDDARRSVRRTAASTRSRWFMLKSK